MWRNTTSSRDRKGIRPDLVVFLSSACNLTLDLISGSCISYHSSRMVIVLPSNPATLTCIFEPGACMKDSKHSTHRLSSRCSFPILAKLRLGSSGVHPLLFASSSRSARAVSSHPTVTLDAQSWRNAPVRIGASQARVPCQSPASWYVACVVLGKVATCETHILSGKSQ